MVSSDPAGTFAPLLTAYSRARTAPLVLGVAQSRYWRAPSQYIAHQQFAIAEEEGDVELAP